MVNATVKGTFRLGDRVIHPDLDRIVGPGGSVDVEPKAMSVLVCLIEHDGEVVSADELIDSVWHGRPMGDNPVYKCITKLRKALGDSAQHPEFIATVPKKGYRILKSARPVEQSARSVAAGNDATVPSAAPVDAPARHAARLILAAAALAVTGIGLYLLTLGSAGNEPTPAIADIDKASIAVLIFKSFGGAEDGPDLGDSTSNEIRLQLARIDGLRVTSRTASLAIAERQTPAHLRDKLRVAYVLEGTIRVVGDRLRYTAQLINTETGFEEWSKVDTRSYRDILDVQVSIARAVVDALRAKVLPDLSMPVANTDSVEAWEAFLRGESYLSRPTDPEFLEAAQTHFEKALAHDPNYARAYGGLCDVYRRWYKRQAAALYFGKAEAACQRALEIDPGLSDVRTDLAHLYRNEGRLDEAEENYRKALDSNPLNLEAYNGIALTFVAANQHEIAEQWFRAGIAKFPAQSAAYSRYAVHVFRRGRYGDALELFGTALRLGGDNASVLSGLAASYTMLGDLEMAERYYGQSLSLKPSARAHANLGNTYYFRGNFVDAVEQFRAAIDLAPADHTNWANLALGLRQLPGRNDEVREVCAKVIALGDEELAINPDDALVLSRIASCMAVLGNTAGAREAVERAAALSPTETNVLYNCAVALVDTGDIEQAALMVMRAVGSGYPESMLKQSPELLPAVRYAEIH